MEGHLQKPEVTGEVRQDYISGNWVVLAPQRSARPDDFADSRPKPENSPKYKDDCPFCNLTAFPQEPDVLRLPDDPMEWRVHIFPNKYPAFVPSAEFKSWNTGPYRVLQAAGYHEILATRWHDQTDALTSHRDLALQLEALVLRYRQLREKTSVNYIQIIKNQGSGAGASLTHPHHQIFTLPMLPDDIAALMRGAKKRMEAAGREPFGVLLDYERQAGDRIVLENEHFTALCPFASRAAYAVQIVPRQPEPYFENSTPEQREALAEVLHDVLAKFYWGLGNPSYNYFIYSAPCDETGFVCDRTAFSSFRWHVEIIPRLTALGGLELSAGVEIVTEAPEAAAALLRSVIVKHG